MTVAEELEAVRRILAMVGKTREMIGKGAVVKLMVVDGDNVIVAYSDLGVTNDCAMEVDVGPKMTKQ